jgi:hypothetical protein
MTSLRDTFQTYSAKAALHLRGKEADALRGQPERLHELELITDGDLLRKYSWRMAIIGTAVSFFAAPLVMVVLQLVLPAVLVHILWFMVKVAMAVAIGLLGLAAYYTFGNGVDGGGA